MRIWNRKMERPKEDDDFVYTSEELEEIEAAKRELWHCEEQLRVANTEWKAVLGTRLSAGTSVIEAASVVSKARFKRHVARRFLRDAYLRYRRAVMPDRLVIMRLGRVIGGYLRERLQQASYVERLFPVIKEKGT